MCRHGLRARRAADRATAGARQVGSGKRKHEPCLRYQRDFAVAIPGHMGSTGLNGNVRRRYLLKQKGTSHESETHQDHVRSGLAGGFRRCLRSGEWLLWQHRMLPQDAGMLLLSDIN